MSGKPLMTSQLSDLLPKRPQNVVPGSFGPQPSMVKPMTISSSGYPVMQPATNEGTAVDYMMQVNLESRD